MLVIQFWGKKQSGFTVPQLKHRPLFESIGWEKEKNLIFLKNVTFFFIPFHYIFRVAGTNLTSFQVEPESVVSAIPLEAFSHVTFMFVKQCLSPSVEHSYWVEIRILGANVLCRWVFVCRKLKISIFVFLPVSIFLV